MSPARTHATCGQFLADRRRQHGLSQREVALRAGTTQASVSRIERDEVSPSLSTLNRLVEAMGDALTIAAVPLADSPPRGGNVSVGRLRSGFDELSPEERLERAGALSRSLSQLATSTRRA